MVVNRTFVGVVCTLEGLLVRGMMVVRYFHHKRWAIALVHWERKSGLGLGEHQVSGMQDRSEQSVGIAVLAYCLWCGLVITRLSLDISGVFFSYSMRCNYGL